MTLPGIKQCYCVIISSKLGTAHFISGIKEGDTDIEDIKDARISASIVTDFESHRFLFTAVCSIFP